jgi:hypothetical protein
MRKNSMCLMGIKNFIIKSDIKNQIKKERLKMTLKNGYFFKSNIAIM